MNRSSILLLNCPDSCTSERQYAVSVVFEKFLGMQCDCVFCCGGKWILTDAEKHKALVMPDVFLAGAEKAWLMPESLPLSPLSRWHVAVDLPDTNLTDPSVPVIAGKKCSNEQWLKQEGNCRLSLGLDVLGAAFFMLSRYEEAVKSRRDNHDRFPSGASLALQECFLDRPIVDEYVEILWACMKRLWPNLERKKRQFKKLISCDVDTPYQYGGSLGSMIRFAGGDIVKRYSIPAAIKRISKFTRWHSGDWSADPHYAAINWIMDVNEEAGNRVTFFFIVDHSSNMDGRYSINEPCIRSLMRRIAERGHEIGLHASYNTYQNPEQTIREADVLRRVLDDEKIQQDKLGNRQHYLRWQTSQTAKNLEAAGIDYDTTLSFADHAGFRCGTCHEFPMYDVIYKRKLKLLEKPLVVMEGSVINENYMGCQVSDSAERKMEMYIEQCRQVNGCFTLLWHNSRLVSDETRGQNCNERYIYRIILNKQ